jgi:hypothetical protein
VLITDREFAPLMATALRLLQHEHGRQIVVIDVNDSEYTGPGELLGMHEYEALLAGHAPLARLDNVQKRPAPKAVNHQHVRPRLGREQRGHGRSNYDLRKESQKQFAQ